MYKVHETHGQIVKVGEEKKNADQGDDAKEDTAHWRLAARRCINLTPTIATKGRQSHEATTNEIGDP